MREFFSVISSHIRSRKKIIVGGLAIALIFSAAPVQSVQANIFSEILGGITNITAAIFFGPLILGVTGFLYFLAFLASWLVAILIEIIKVIALSSLTIPVLPNSGINVVTVGWEFTRNFVNLLFILILVFIGLATILRMQSYGLQKTLPLLIAVALLVNFSGVFVGFIVDMANLVTGVFVQKIQGLGFGLGSSFAIGKTVVQDLVGFFTSLTAIGSIAVPALKALVLLIFYAAFALILFIVMLLFIVRIGMLWLLTILAPLAFAAYILPATKKLTTQWFQQLIQWAIIGIPMAFFLWLAQAAIVGVPEISAAFRGIAPLSFLDPDPDTRIAQLTLAQVIMSFTGPVVALLILGAGVTVSMQFAPATSKAIISIGKSKQGRKFFRQALGGAGTFAWDRKLPKMLGGKSIGERTGAVGTLIREKTETTPWYRGGALARQFGRTIEMGAGKINEQVAKNKRDDATEAEKAARNKPSSENINNMNTELEKPPIAQNMESLTGKYGGTIENGDPDDMYDAMFPKTGKHKMFDWKNIPRIFKAAYTLGPPFYRKIAKANIGRLPELAAVVENRTPQSLVQETLDKATGEDVKKEFIPKQYLNPSYTNPNDPQHASERAAWVIDKLVNTTLTSPSVGPALLETKKEVRENVISYLQTKDLNWFLANNAEGLVRASRKSPGLQAIGAAPFLPGIRDRVLDEAVRTRENTRNNNINLRRDELVAAGTLEPEAQKRAELEQLEREVRDRTRINALSMKKTTAEADREASSALTAFRNGPDEEKKRPWVWIPDWMM